MIEKSQYRSAIRSKKFIKNAFSELLQKKELEKIKIGRASCRERVY